MTWIIAPIAATLAIALLGEIARLRDKRKKRQFETWIGTREPNDGSRAGKGGGNLGKYASPSLFVNTPINTPINTPPITTAVHETFLTPRAPLPRQSHRDENTQAPQRLPGPGQPTTHPGGSSHPEPPRASQEETPASPTARDATDAPPNGPYLPNKDTPFNGDIWLESRADKGKGGACRPSDDSSCCQMAAKLGTAELVEKSVVLELIDGAREHWQTQAAAGFAQACVLGQLVRLRAAVEGLPAPSIGEIACTDGSDPGFRT